MKKKKKSKNFYLKTQLLVVKFLIYLNRRVFVTFSRRHIEIFFLTFSRTQDLTFHANCLQSSICLFMLRFYSPVNPLGLCRAQTVYLTTLYSGQA